MRSELHNHQLNQNHFYFYSVVFFFSPIFMDIWKEGIENVELCRIDDEYLKTLVSILSAVIRYWRRKNIENRSKNDHAKAKSFAVTWCSSGRNIFISSMCANATFVSNFSSKFSQILFEVKENKTDEKTNGEAPPDLSLHTSKMWSAPSETEMNSFAKSCKSCRNRFYSTKHRTNCQVVGNDDARTLRTIEDNDDETVVITKQKALITFSLEMLRWNRIARFRQIHSGRFIDNDVPRLLLIFLPFSAIKYIVLIETRHQRAKLIRTLETIFYVTEPTDEADMKRQPLLRN